MKEKKIEIPTDLIVRWLKQGGATVYTYKINRIIIYLNNVK